MRRNHVSSVNDPSSPVALWWPSPLPLPLHDSTPDLSRPEGATSPHERKGALRLVWMETLRCEDGLPE